MAAFPAMAIELRPATDGDLPAVLGLLQASLGWVPDDQHEAFFRWKHHENPFGASPAWVATDAGRIVAFRTFLRWEWRRDGRVVRAVRAVDTATHPDAQGKGLFRALTLHAVDAAHTDGVAFVFNTPNDQSRPGYLKMGWHDVGRLATHVRPRSVASATKLVTARVPADLWSQASDVGIAGADAFADDDAVARLIGSLPEAPAGSLRTNRSGAHLRWRYGFAPLAYRAVPLADGVASGVVVFRLRRRGAALEMAVTDVLAPPRSARRVRHAVRRALSETGADHAIALGPDRRITEGFLPLPRQGPRFTWRAVCEETPPPLGAWRPSLGDIELL